MNHIENWLCIVLVSMLLFPLVNCSNEDDTQDARPIISGLTVSESDVIIQGSSSGTFEIKTSSTWRIDVPENAFRWLTVTSAEGIGNSTITYKTKTPEYREIFKDNIVAVNKLANINTAVSVTCMPNNTAPGAPAGAVCQ